MATTGTINTTVINNAKVIEHAFRRCGGDTAKLTPEIVDMSLSCLFLLLLELIGRGLNLWCVDRLLLGLTAGQATYILPNGAVAILNANYSIPTLATGIGVQTSNKYALTFPSVQTLHRIGVKFASVIAGDSITINADGQTVLTNKPQTLQAGIWYWFLIDPSASGILWEITTGNPSTIMEVASCTAVSDTPLTPWSRDTYMAQNNKYQPGRPATNFFPEKKNPPQVTIFPVPTVSTDHLYLVVHRQVQDIGNLVNNMEVPSRWYEAIIWQLALRLMFELPPAMVDQARYAGIKDMCQSTLIDTETEESDGAPIRLAPNIRGYTR